MIVLWTVKVSIINSTSGDTAYQLRQKTSISRKKIKTEQFYDHRVYILVFVLYEYVVLDVFEGEMFTCKKLISWYSDAKPEHTKVSLSYEDMKSKSCDQEPHSKIQPKMIRYLTLDVVPIEVF